MFVYCISSQYMTTLHQIQQDDQELASLLRPVNEQRIKDEATSGKYNTTVDDHVSSSSIIQEEFDKVMKEYQALKTEYYSTYVASSDTTNNERINKFNNQVSNYWDYDSYVKRENDKYYRNSEEWKRYQKQDTRSWNDQMQQYRVDDDKYNKDKKERHARSLNKIRARETVAATTRADYYVNDYRERSNALYGADSRRDMEFWTYNDKHNANWNPVKRWEKSGYSLTAPTQNVGMMLVGNSGWTMGGQKSDRYGFMGGNLWNGSPWGVIGGGLNTGDRIWYGHGPRNWSRNESSWYSNTWWGRWWADMSAYNRKQENWGLQPLNVPYIMYKPFFVDPDGDITGYLYGWTDDACRVYVNNVDVYGKVIEGGWSQGGWWSAAGGKVGNKSGPIKLNKGFNLIMVIGLNKGGPAGMQWTMWNSPLYDKAPGLNLPRWWWRFPWYDYYKKGILVRTDVTWRCILQNVEAPQLGTYHKQTNKTPYSDTNCSLPDFIKKDSDLVKEFVVSNLKRFAAAKKVRYIRVFLSDKIGGGEACLQISQLAVYPMDNQGVNIAKYKPTEATPGYGRGWDIKSSTAVDGNLGARAFPYIYHSNCTKGSYWQVDLESPRDIFKIVYYNRGDCCQWRARNLQLQFMDENKKVTWTGPAFGSSASIQTFSFSATDVAGPPDQPDWGSTYSTENIYVGPGGPVKTVSLPRANMIISPTPLNDQDPRWRDRFAVEVVGNTLTVRRTDSNSAWTQELMLGTVTRPEKKPTPPVLQPNIWPTMDEYNTPQLILLEKISAKNSELVKVSEKLHLHYAAVARDKGDKLSKYESDNDIRYSDLTARYMAMLEERKIVEEAIAEYDTMRTEEISTEMNIDSSRLVYWAWGITAITLVILIMLYVFIPTVGMSVKGEVASLFVILACTALLSAFLGMSHMILPIWIITIFAVIYYLRVRSKSGSTPSVPSVPSSSMSQ